jgi:hypothetical protein
MNLDELSQRLVKCKHFQWMPGMKTVSGARVLAVKDDDLVIDEINDNAPAFRPRLPSFERLKASDELPDLTNPATLGCLLHLVREAWRDPSYTTRAWQGSSGDLLWHMALAKSVTAGMLGVFLQSYASEAEALVAALEAAP